MTPDQPPLLTTRTTFAAGSAVVKVSGEIDLSTAAGLAASLDVIVARHPHELVLDLGGLSFIDSTGLTLLARTSTRLGAEEGVLRIVSATPPVRRVLEIVGMQHLLVA